MNTRIRNLSASCLLVAATISGVSGAYAAEFTAKIGHLESAQQSRHVHLEKVAELVAERTGGAVDAGRVSGAGGTGAPASGAS